MLWRHREQQQRHNLLGDERRGCQLWVAPGPPDSSVQAPAQVSSNSAVAGVTLGECCKGGVPGGACGPAHVFGHLRWGSEGAQWLGQELWFRAAVPWGIGVPGPALGALLGWVVPASAFLLPKVGPA